MDSEAAFQRTEEFIMFEYIRACRFFNEDTGEEYELYEMYDENAVLNFSLRTKEEL